MASFDGFPQRAWAEHAVRLAAALAADAAVHRPLAVACNNMAWQLHDHGGARSAEEACRTTLAALQALAR